MKVLLDTTYLLPTISVTVDIISPSFLHRILTTNVHEFYFSELSLFELAAKGAKLVSQKDNTLVVADITRGLDALRWDKRLRALPWYTNPLLLELAVKIRVFHSDFFDCLILSTAVCFAEVFATFDQDLFEKIRTHPPLIQEVRALNDSFRFWFHDLSSEPIAL
ncbi:MAG: hypothetical protein GF364_16820 [Candidatus Lokiarchaeota archaeon]|nr:hypothetical protein [Candidatus Lokiarchaeota archaeon]